MPRSSQPPPVKLSAQDLTDVCWALASFGFTPPNAWILKLEQELTRRCSASSLNPPATHVAAAAGSGCSLSPCQLAVVLWSLEGFGWVPRTTAFVECVDGAIKAPS